MIWYLRGSFLDSGPRVVINSSLCRSHVYRSSKTQTVSSVFMVPYFRCFLRTNVELYKYSIQSSGIKKSMARYVNIFVDITLNL